MAKPSDVRKLTLPPRERPHWNAPSGSDLMLLGWGSRYYGEQPMPVTQHAGWPFLVILKGTPTLVLGDRRHKLTAGSLLVVHPDCAAGWSDRPGRDCEILSWVWRDEPPTDLGLPQGGLKISSSAAPGMRRLEALHEMCRREVAASDAVALPNLRALRTLVENEFIRHAVERAGNSESLVRLQLAIDYLKAHLGRRDVINLLRDYLGVTSVELQKLFREHLRCTPALHLYRLRMEKAQTLIRDQEISAKETAFILGYAHANDLSRAFARYFGRTVREVQIKAKERAVN